jgi:hypothetical protein
MKPRLRRSARTDGRPTHRLSPRRPARVGRAARVLRLRRRRGSHPALGPIRLILVRRSPSDWTISFLATSATTAWMRGCCRRSCCAIDTSPSGCVAVALKRTRSRTRFPGRAGADGPGAQVLKPNCRVRRESARANIQMAPPGWSARAGERRGDRLQKRRNPACAGLLRGAAEGTRTLDLLHGKQTL